MTRRKIEYWVIPPQADAEFVANMEQVLDLYQKPYDPDCPVVCMDEQPVQLVKETRAPMAATKNRPRRVDYEYERAGTASVFLFSEPLASWRQATARARRRKADWALEVAGLLEGRYADCEKIALVCDNLNTHTKGAFYAGVRADPGAAIGSSHRLLLHAETRELAEHRGERTQFDDAPMRARAPHRRPRHAARRSVGVVHRRQWHATRCRLANEGRRCAL